MSVARLDPCAAFKQSLDQIRGNGAQGALEGRAGYYRQLEDETLFRAIAAVSEAISMNGQVAFSLLDHLHTGSGPDEAQRIARPGNDAFYPFAVGGTSTAAAESRGGHLALLVFRREGRNLAADHYDSGERRMPIHATYVRARDRLLDNGWQDLDNVDRPAFPLPLAQQPARRQVNGWACGVHVILNAWALALGLQIRSTGCHLGNGFYQQAVEIINLAMLGRMNSDTIRNFLACWEFITADSQVGEGRAFAITTAFGSLQELSEHIARVRLEEDLDALRVDRADVPNLETALDVLGDIVGENIGAALIQTTARRLLDLYEVVTGTAVPTGRE